MLLVVLAFLAAAGGALLLYQRVERVGPGALPLAALRATAWGTVAALLVNPGCRRAGTAAPTVLLDGSASMTDPSGDARWRAARDSARAAAGRGGRILLFGLEPRLFADGAAPDAPASRLLPALREAAARGGPIVVVSDGEIEDAAALPADLLRAARVVVLERPRERDAGVVALDLPASLRAGDTALASVDVVATGAGPGDTLTVTLAEQGRIVARARIAIGAGGLVRHEFRFVPAAAPGAREVRRYEARLSGLAGDAEPRDDARTTAVSVTRASTIVMISDAPDWDFRWLAQTLRSTSGVPVRSYVRLLAGGWRETQTLRPVAEAQIRSEVGRAALVVAHGGTGVQPMAAAAPGALWRWVSVDGAGGDWYVLAPESSSPVGDAFAGAPPESLPPLESAADLPPDSLEWTAVAAQLERRGRARAVLQGQGTGRRLVRVGASGFWRWASKGGVAGEAYRALVAGLTDWLLVDPTPGRADLLTLRDSLAASGREFLPRTRSLAPQQGVGGAAAAPPAPLRHSPWLFGVALAALLAEWIARRRRGLR